MPVCPRPGHEGSRVVFDGHYGKPGHRRQRYRCHPPNGDKWHRFTPPLPRQDAVGGECLHCERELHAHEGPHTPHDSLFSARDVSLGLVEVGRGESYRAASAKVRTRADRHPEAEDGAGYSRHGQLVGDLLEVFAPVVFEPYRPSLWPDGTLVIDQVPFRVRSLGPDGRPVPGGVVAFNVFGALGYRDGRGMLWRLQAFHTASADDWEAFLCALDGEPKRIVCDAHTGIRSAVEHVFPNADIWLCEWHLREKLRLRLVRARANSSSDRVWRRLPAAVHSAHGWEQFCAAAYRHRPVLREVRSWIDRWDETVRAQLGRRPSKWQREHGDVVSSAGLDRRLNVVRGWLTPRRNALGNRERLNRLLMLMQLQLNDVADEARYAGHIRDWLDARNGRATDRRLIVDAAGYPSLRSD
jgi:hypothetical protein